LERSHPRLIEERTTATEDEIAWQLVREVSIKGAALLKPIFDSQGGRNGRLSIQTDPRCTAMLLRSFSKPTNSTAWRRT